MTIRYSRIRGSSIKMAGLTGERNVFFLLMISLTIFIAVVNLDMVSYDSSKIISTIGCGIYTMYYAYGM